MLMVCDNGCKHIETSTSGVGEGGLNDVLGGVLAYLLSADRRECPADTSVQQAHIVIYLGGGAYGGA